MEERLKKLEAGSNPKSWMEKLPEMNNRLDKLEELLKKLEETRSGEDAV